MNPIQDFRTERSQKRKETELAHWERWKQAPAHEKPQYLKPLLDAYEPTFKQKEKLWRPPEVKSSAFQAEVQRQFVNALHTWDPSRAALSTHVEHHLPKVLRYVTHYQNFGYQPEAQVQLIGPINKAKDELYEDLGREPTDAEIAAHINDPKVTTKRVTTVRTGMRKDLPSSLWESPEPVLQASTRMQEIMPLLRDELSTQDERRVFDHVFGLNGAKKITETGALARELGKNQSQISRIKKRIAGKISEYK